MKRILLTIGAVFCALLFTVPASARSIKEKLEATLFGGRSSSVLTVGGRPLLSAEIETFGQPILAIGNIGSVVANTLGREIISESAAVPVPSGSAGFAYRYNPSLNVFERTAIGLGTVFNERAYVLGKGQLAFGVAYVRQEFDEFNGQDISDLTIGPGLFSRSPSFGALVDTGVVEAQLDLKLRTDSVAFWVTYGLTEWLDVSILLPLTTINLRARSTVRQVSDALADNLPAFLSNSTCTVAQAVDGRCRIADFIILREGTPFSISNPRTGEVTTSFSNRVDDEKTGFGDLILRGKARFLEHAWGTFGGLTEFTLPTGEKDNYLGDDAFKARFLLLYSQGLFNDRLHFHLNGGGKVTTQTSQKNTLEYGSAVDFSVTQRLSLVAELIGSWRVDSEGLPDNFIDGAFGFKVNLFRGLIVNASFRIPATDDGLRSDLVYLAGLEYDF